ncbi:putative Peroxidase 48 [Herrania umbratica]|uniref:peroxidase n=1 Tax=Herrania umbratica TaxID=108875 RepID=A0A6J1BGN4_9ROSI|nr:putative Peroxidase 48 [Herrania umbratica]
MNDNYYEINGYDRNTNKVTWNSLNGLSVKKGIFVISISTLSRHFDGLPRGRDNPFKEESQKRNKERRAEKTKERKPKKMPRSFSEPATMRTLSFFIVLLCVWISFRMTNRSNHFSFSFSSSFSLNSNSNSFWIFQDILLDSEALEDGQAPARSLEYDFYRETCPEADKVIRAKVHQLFKIKASLAPALLRLAFHDCFIEGCDASILLDAVEGMDSEKDSPPNESLKGFDVIDIIKSDVEQVCPGVVSCADILVLAAREAALLAGGPFYPLNTGRRDSTAAFSDSATNELPSPHADLSETLASFSSRGFDERETVALLGAHSIGVIHCKFFQNRLYNFGGTDEPDPTLDSEILKKMRSKCPKNHSSTSPAASPFSDGSPMQTPLSPPLYDSLSSAVAPSTSFDKLLSSSPKDQGTVMTYEGTGADFGTVYYRSLLQGKGILYADQQLMAGEETGLWVRAYASDASLYQRDFALAMMKLSNLHVLTAPRGQIRLNCSRVA